MHVKAAPALIPFLLVPLLMSGCSNGAEASNPSSPSPTATATPTPTPAPVAKPVRDPLTGLGRVAGPVVAVKVDNGVLARPYQRGLNQAAVIYQELVEGGATRFMAVFESRAATGEVGPIRSARESDLDILRAYGKPGLAFSGANSGVFAIVRAAARAGRVIDASYEATPGSYRLGERRRDARNFFAVPAKLGERRGGSEPRNIGLRFGPAVGGTPALSASVRFSPLTLMKVRYNRSKGTWAISEGRHVVPFAADNVIVQYVTIKNSRFHDTNGMNSPYTVSTGSGKAILLRDGKSFQGTWKRTGFGATRFLDATGKDMLLKPGRTWVMLTSKKRTVVKLG